MKNEANRVFGNSEQPQFPDLIKAGLKVGDTVYSYMFGDGVVTEGWEEEYVIGVQFKDNFMTFNKYGFKSKFCKLPSIHLHPWNPIQGEPFPFPKWEPIVGEKYGFWGNILLQHSLVYGTFNCKMADKFMIIGSDYLFEHCAPIFEAMRIFGFDKLGEGDV
jgi:hypothetical protein